MSSHAVHEAESEARVRAADERALASGDTRSELERHALRRRAATRSSRLARERAASPLLTPFVASVCLGAAAIVLFGAADGLGGRPGLAVTLIAAATAASFFPVRFPGRRFDVNAAHPFVFCAMAACGPFAAALADAAGVFATALGRGRRPQLRHLLFNLGLVAVCTSAAWQAWAAAGGAAAPGLLPTLLSMFAAGAAYYATNVSLLGITIALEKRRALFSVVRDAVLPTFAPFFAGVLLASVMLPAMTRFPVFGVGLGFATCAVLIGMFRVLSRSVSGDADDADDADGAAEIV